MEENQTMLSPLARTNGRALFLSEKGSIYIARKYSVYRSDDNGYSWILDCIVPSSGWKPLVANISIAARLLRFNIQAFQVLPDGARIAVARDGIYRAEPGVVEMRRTWSVTRGSRPINLSADGSRVLFGEYGGAELDSVQVRVYVSDDGGKMFEPAFEFPKGDIHHVHNVVVDHHANHYWVFAGDHGRTPGIGALSNDFRHFDWLVRGSQMVRAVSAIVRSDCLIYGSDSELEQNYIVRLDKKTGAFERLIPIEGSSLYAADFGSVSLISTCVELSAANRSKSCGLYASNDNLSWVKTISLTKDIWHPQLFQFGLIVLPTIQGAHKQGLFSGQALTGWHDSVALFNID